MLEFKDKNVFLTYEEVEKMWTGRKNKDINKYLLIIIDSCHSGHWVNKRKDVTIFIQASSMHFQTSSDMNGNLDCYGGVLMNNFINRNSKQLDKIIVKPEQKPVFIGSKEIVEKIFGLEILFDTWDEFKYYKSHKRIDGVSYWANGNKYEGYFKDDKRNGKGVFYWANGDKYEGDFKDDKRTGKGVLYWADGDKYEGDFKDDKKNGKGVYEIYSI